MVMTATCSEGSSLTHYAMGGATQSKQSANGLIAGRPGARWVPDDLFPHCYRCNAKFTVAVRRHHCRMCGAVYCAECCPKTNAIAASVVRDNVSMPRQQRAMERLCRSCRLPSWLLPMTVDRVPGGSDRGVEANTAPPPPRRDAGDRGKEFWQDWLKNHLEPRVDGRIMQTILEFSTNSGRNAILQTHPSIRHCLPMPAIETSDAYIPMVMYASVAAVYPGVVAIGDGGFSGGFRKGMDGITASMMSPVTSHARSGPAALDPRKAGVAHLGTGGGGSVYYALDRTRNCFVAVKLIAKSFAGGPMPYRYERTFGSIAKEIQIHADLDDMRIARLHSVFQTRGHVVMVSDAGEGRTARNAAIEVRNYDDEEAVHPTPGRKLVPDGVSPRSAPQLPSIVPFTLRVVQGVVRALKYMASKGYVHRDVKLDNVILSRDYSTVRLIDFGLAERINSDGRNGLGVYSPLGTPSYLSPENVACVARGERRFEANVSTILACDVFSVGVMAYMMLSNRRIYGSLKDYREMLKRAREGFRCRGEGWECVPPSIASLVESMLAFEPHHRPSFDDILSHASFREHAKPMEDVVKLRYERISEADFELHQRWDMCLDANDESDDDVPLVGSNGAASGGSGAYGGGSAGTPVSARELAEATIRPKRSTAQTAAAAAASARTAGAAPQSATASSSPLAVKPANRGARLGPHGTPRQAGVVVMSAYDDDVAATAPGPSGRAGAGAAGAPIGDDADDDGGPAMRRRPLEDQSMRLDTTAHL
jgi:serine/threonine protein kinase